jgi:hypothetical protein
MQLLVDYWRLDPVQIVSESTATNEMKIRGIFGRADEFNNNNRRYPKALLEREVNKMLPLIQENRLLGELDHPDRPNVSLTNASHLVTNLYWQGNVLIGEAKVLNTPSGKVAQQLIKDGVKIGVSSRGLGTLKACTEFPGKFEVNEDFKAVTFDLVADPSTKGAYPSPVNESQLYEKTKKEAFSQNLIIKLFESKLSKIKEDKIRKLFAKPVNEGSMGEKRLVRVKKALAKKEVKESSKRSNDAKRLHKKRKALGNYTSESINEGKTTGSDIGSTALRVSTATPKESRPKTRAANILGRIFRRHGLKGAEAYHSVKKATEGLPKRPSPGEVKKGKKAKK